MKLFSCWIQTRAEGVKRNCLELSGKGKYEGHQKVQQNLKMLSSRIEVNLSMRQFQSQLIQLNSTYPTGEFFNSQ